MKIYLIAGETSGDLHGGALIEALKSVLPEMECRGVGGEQMQKAGMELCWHYREQNYMGFVEIIKHLPAIFKKFKTTKKDILSFRPDFIILIDYPAFNLRLVKFLRKNGIKIIYFISPQIWAWKTSRVKLIKKYVDRMITILPFEKAFYAQYGVSVDYVGHPLKQKIDIFLAEYLQEKPVPETRPTIVLLPGSRRMEVKQMLPVMVAAVKPFLDRYRVLVAIAPSVPEDLILPWIAGTTIEVSHEGAYPLLARADAALVTSGTATLETALFRVPQVVLYRGNPVSVWLARRFIKVKYISLVNLILQKLVVKELIQSDMQEEKVRMALEQILSGPRRAEMLQDYNSLHEVLYAENSYQVAAGNILELVRASRR